MMRRGRNEADSRSRVPHFGNMRVNLVYRQLPTFTRLCALRNLDLQFLSVNQIVAGYPKATRRYLLNRAVSRIAVRINEIAPRIFPALAGLEALNDLCHRLNLIDWNRFAFRSEFHQATQSAKPLRLIVNQLAVLFEDLVTVHTTSMLEFVDRLRVEQVVFPLTPVAVLPTAVEGSSVARAIGEGSLVPQPGFFGNYIQADAANA